MINKYNFNFIFLLFYFSFMYLLFCHDFTLSPIFLIYIPIYMYNKIYTIYLDKNIYPHFIILSENFICTILYMNSICDKRTNRPDFRHKQHRKSATEPNLCLQGIEYACNKVCQVML